MNPLFTFRILFGRIHKAVSYYQLHAKDIQEAHRVVNYLFPDQHILNLTNLSEDRFLKLAEYDQKKHGRIWSGKPWNCCYE